MFESIGCRIEIEAARFKRSWITAFCMFAESYKTGELKGKDSAASHRLEWPRFRK
jgi:hypothetical protein